jgi:hypothetical protein
MSFRTHHALLLECHGWGVVVTSAVIDTAPGMPTGARGIRVDRSRLWERVPSQPVLLLGRLVDSRLGDRARIGVYHSCPKIHAPPIDLRRV